jgi:hypothetical protein
MGAEADNGWWVAYSSWTLLAVPIILWWRGLFQHYVMLCTVSIMASFFSFMWHMCYEPGLEYCLDQNPASGEAIDELFAFWTLVLSVGPFIEFWAPTKNNLTWRTHWDVCMSIMVAVMVRCLEDHVATYVVVAVCAGLAFLYVTVVEFMRRHQPDHAKGPWWWFRAGCVVLTAAVLGLTFGMSKSTLISFSENRRWHAWWHVSSALTLTFALSLLPGYEKLPGYQPVTVVNSTTTLPSRVKGKYSGLVQSVTRSK